MKFIGAAALALAFCTETVHAWEFTPGTPCILTHETTELAIKLTFYPSVPVYTIALTYRAGWPSEPVFSIQFSGARPSRISTGRHQFSDGNQTLTVTDSGFGNVLDGLQFGTSFEAIIGDQVLSVPLTNAAAPVAAFRACEDIPAV